MQQKEPGKRLKEIAEEQERCVRRIAQLYREQQAILSANRDAELYPLMKWQASGYVRTRKMEPA